ncbi:MAG: RnfH family protein, partial [Gammaproteobacteria bacterium]|nr:RnfH family protein [Gammaproteobacteria bacterium]
EAVRQSKIDEFFPEMDLDQCDLGVFGKQVLDSYELLLDGDRIEIYRQLIADPKEVRRQRAAQGLKAKNGGAGANT